MFYGAMKTPGMNLGVTSPVILVELPVVLI